MSRKKEQSHRNGRNAGIPAILEESRVNMLKSRGISMNQPSKPWVAKYLESMRLEPMVPRKEELSFAYLKQICSAHLNTFAFENISKFLYYRDWKQNGYFVPPVEVFVDNYQKYGFGGTCYTQNTNLYRLLQGLGYDCNLVTLGGEHMAILVRLVELGNEQVYVDCGAAAPFFSPVRFETDVNNVSSFGTDKIMIRSLLGQQGKYVYSRYVNNEPSGEPWEFDANRRSELDDFQPLIEEANKPGATFMTFLRCQLWQLDKSRSVSLVDNTFGIRMADGSLVKRKLCTVEDIEQVITEEFGLPRLPVRSAIEILHKLDVDIFSAD